MSTLTTSPQSILAPKHRASKPQRRRALRSRAHRHRPELDRLEDRLLLASEAGNLDQFANLAPGSWVNGNLGSSKANYLEGDDIPYRLRFSNITGVGTSATHTVVIQWDTTKGGLHALDYLTTFDYKLSVPAGVNTTKPDPL